MRVLSQMRSGFGRLMAVVIANLEWSAPACTLPACHLHLPACGIGILSPSSAGIELSTEIPRVAKPP